jgi:manganese/zinc/iron transport system substrate-binding protein
VKQINDLVSFLVDRKIKAVFVETSVSDQNVRSLLEGCAAQEHDVKIGGELFSDAMGAEGTPGGTYEGMIRHNVETIVKALQ